MRASDVITNVTEQNMNIMVLKDVRRWRNRNKVFHQNVPYILGPNIYSIIRSELHSKKMHAHQYLTVLLRNRGKKKWDQNQNILLVAHQ